MREREAGRIPQEELTQKEPSQEEHSIFEGLPPRGLEREMLLSKIHGRIEETEQRLKEKWVQGRDKDIDKELGGIETDKLTHQPLEPSHMQSMEYQQLEDYFDIVNDIVRF